MKRIRKYGVILLLLSVVLTACGGKATPAAPTEDPSIVRTSAASTALARLTEIALLTPSPTSTTAPTATSAPTNTPTVSPTAPTAAVSPTGALSTAGAATGDKAEFVADMTISDGTEIAPGASFTKTWRLKNVGTTTWLASHYTLVHISNDAISGPASVNFPKDVAPGESVDLSVDLKAPTTTGSHISYWKLKNDRSLLFGIGPTGQDSFYVQIKVVVGTGTTQLAPTATNSNGAGLVTATNITIDPATFTGACPKKHTITILFNLVSASTLTYKLEAGSDTPGFTFTIPGAQTNSFPAGQSTLVFDLDLSSSGSGWVKFHITSPVDHVSLPATFNLTCE
ncbi:MAG: hypothetical protein EHM41_17580 [Chloroflexi bacterium]|nr:MAG: hypothetical protein EHM41_17580 [Chloroflexota bacterium]